MGIPGSGGYVRSYSIADLLDCVFKNCENLLYYAIKFYIIPFVDKYKKRHYYKIKDRAIQFIIAWAKKDKVIYCRRYTC